MVDDTSMHLMHTTHPARTSRLSQDVRARLWNGLCEGMWELSPSIPRLDETQSETRVFCSEEGKGLVVDESSGMHRVDIDSSKLRKPTPDACRCFGEKQVGAFDVMRRVGAGKFGVLFECTLAKNDVACWKDDDRAAGEVRGIDTHASYAVKVIQKRGLLDRRRAKQAWRAVRHVESCVGDYGWKPGAPQY
jgi:hypothetical protein